MLNSPAEQNTQPVARAFRIAPGRSARHIYDVLDASVRRFLHGEEHPRGTHSRAGGAGARGETTASREHPLRSLARDRPELDEARVREWKRTWVSGAEGRWAGTSLLVNPHKPGSSRATAWRAGWHWADGQPDRRRPGQVRFAHPYRRSTDSSARRVRRAQAGAVGVSMLTIAGWVWHMRRQRTRIHSGM
jgi:hypothetical protein